MFKRDKILGLIFLSFASLFFFQNVFSLDWNLDFGYATVNNSNLWAGNAWSDTRWLNIDGSNADTDIDILTHGYRGFTGTFTSSMTTSHAVVDDIYGTGGFVKGFNFNGANWELGSDLDGLNYNYITTGKITGNRLVATNQMNATTINTTTANVQSLYFGDKSIYLNGTNGRIFFNSLNQSWNHSCFIDLSNQYYRMVWNCSGGMGGDSNTGDTILWQSSLGVNDDIQFQLGSSSDTRISWTNYLGTASNNIGALRISVPSKWEGTETGNVVILPTILSVNLSLPVSNDSVLWIGGRNKSALRDNRLLGYITANTTRVIIGIWNATNKDRITLANHTEVNGNLSVSEIIRTYQNYSVGNSQGITRNITILKSAGVNCDMNFSGGILIASSC